MFAFIISILGGVIIDRQEGMQIFKVSSWCLNKTVCKLIRLMSDYIQPYSLPAITDIFERRKAMNFKERWLYAIGTFLMFHSLFYLSHIEFHFMDTVVDQSVNHQRASKSSLTVTI